MPPVEAPITTTFSVVSSIAPVGRESMASAVSFGSTFRIGSRIPSRACAAALTAWQSVTEASSRNSLVPKRGLAMISTAPYSSALRVLCAPSSARLEQIITGSGCWLMIFCRKVKPSILGISMSSVITSGISSRMRSAATNGSAAVPITSISGSRDKMSLSVRRTTAESSTIRTRILGFSIASVRLLPSRQPV